MSKPTVPFPTRDDRDQDRLIGNVKVTREDWLNLAREVLVHEGVAELKILKLSTRLNVSRSSFYWYFKNHRDLLSALLDEWQSRNTQTIVTHCALPADGINGAVCNLFRCFADPDLFDRKLDFAVREWARRDSDVNQLIESADQARVTAITDMFRRYGYSDYDADARARIVYFMQIGYYAAEMRETIELRLSRMEGFLKGFTGQEPDPQIVAEFKEFALSKNGPS